MNLKSYLRGIGAGMIVTALIMGVALPKNVTATEEKKQTLLETAASVEEAKNTELNDESNDTTEKSDKIGAVEKVEIMEPEATGEDATESETAESEANESEANESEADDSETTEPSESEIVETDIEETEIEVTPAPINPLPEDETGFSQEGTLVEIKVISGDSSVSVSRRMYEAGLVESAVEFDTYLCQNGYDKYICVGSYEIEEGSDFETMAKIITRRK